MDKLQMRDTHAYTVLSNLVESNKRAQNLLFTGSNEHIKDALTTYYLQEIFCEEGVKPCGQCQACEMIERRQHPDVYWYEVDTKFGKDEMTDLQVKMSQNGLLGPHRAYVIKQLDNLTIQAQNAWLKLLEEPYPHVYCIAWIDNENQILPTIKSRFLSLFVHNKQMDQAEFAFLALASEFISRYQQSVHSLDLLLLLEKNLKIAEDFSRFLESLLNTVVTENGYITIGPMISKARKMIDANVPQDQVALYFCLNVYNEEYDNE